MIVSELLGICFPHLAGVHIDRLFCYERRLFDQAPAGHEIVIHLQAARYFCRDTGHLRRAGARRHGGDSTALREALTAIAPAT